MVNGENPHVGFDFYVDTIAQAARRRCRTCTSSATRRREIHHMTTLSGLTHEQVLRELKAAGLGSLPGRRRRGLRRPRAAARRARARSTRTSGSTSTTPPTGSGSRRTARCSTATSRPTRSAIDHLLRLRDQQDATGGFLAFIPLAFHPENTVFERRGFTSHDRRRRPEDARRLAADARQHPEHQGVLDHDGRCRSPQVALHFGANDVQGTVVREEIFHAAGATHGDRAEDRASSSASSARPAASPCSATRSTTSCGDGGAA